LSRFCPSIKKRCPVRNGVSCSTRLIGRDSYFIACDPEPDVPPNFISAGATLWRKAGSGVALVPPIVVQDELGTCRLVEHRRIPELRGISTAIVQIHRLPKPLFGELIGRKSAAA
jgi:hypothetical protein